MRRCITLLAVLLSACDPEPRTVPASSCDDVPTTYLGDYMGLSNRAQGLWTNPNVQSDAPDGALHKAENIELDRSGYARPRVGQQRLAAPYATGERFRAGIEYQGYTFEFASVTPGGSGTLYRRNISTGILSAIMLPSGSSVLTPPSGVQRPRFSIAGGDLYVTTFSGLIVFDGPTSAPTTVGFERLPDIEPIIGGSSGTTPIGANMGVAYRATVVRTDSEGVEHESAPSGRRIFLNNAPGSVPVWTTTTIYLPAATKAGDRARLYRTLQVDLTNPASQEPGDTAYLVADKVIVEADIGLGFVTVMDHTPEILVGDPLYTNPTLEGILGGNLAPPIAADALRFGQGTEAGKMMLANIHGADAITVRLIGLPPSTTIYTIAGVGISFSPPTPTGDTAVDIVNYARELVKTINLSTSFTNVRGFYVSGESDPPGIVMFERTTPLGGPFTLVVNANGALFEPELTVPLPSTPDIQPNGVVVSKEGQHYAFPLYSQNRLRIGRDDKAILRMAALRSDVYVFKDGEGIFKLTPIGDGWNVEHMNQEVSLLIPESLAVLDNRIIAYTTRGVVAVDAYGVEEIDVPVKDYTEALATLPATTVQAHTFAAADPQRLCYWLWFPENASDTTATRALLWNGRANPPAWTERTDSASGGFVTPGGRLFLGESSTASSTQSRNTGTADDFQGPDSDSYTVAIQWPHRADGMPGESKQYRQVRLFFERAVGTQSTPLPVAWKFTNDYALESPVRTNQVYGLPYSTMEPDPGWQRTSDLGTEVSFPILRQYVVVKGIEEVASGTAPVRGR